MKKTLILGLSLMLCACNSNSISNEIKQVMENSEYIIIDVRTKEEYNKTHVKGAINIPYNKINENIKIDKDKAIFVYCKSGSRSEVAYNILENLGYEVYDLGAFSNIDLPKE